MTSAASGGLQRVKVASAETRIVLWTILDQNSKLNVSLDVTRRNRPTSHTKTLYVTILREILRTKVIDPTNGTDFRVFNFGGHTGGKSKSKIWEENNSALSHREIDSNCDADESRFHRVELSFARENLLGVWESL